MSKTYAKRIIILLIPILVTIFIFNAKVILNSLKYHYNNIIYNQIKIKDSELKYFINIKISIKSIAEGEEYFFSIFRIKDKKIIYQTTSKTCTKNPICLKNIEIAYSNLGIINTNYQKTKFDTMNDAYLNLHYNTNAIKLNDGTLSGLKIGFYDIRKRCLVLVCKKGEITPYYVEFIPKSDFSSSKKTQITAKFDVEKDFNSLGEEITVINAEKWVGIGNF